MPTKLQPSKLLILAAAGLCVSLAAAGLYGQSAAEPKAPAARPPSKWEQALETDPNNLKTYRDADEKLGAPAPGENRVVFMGDSITANWQRTFAQAFPGKPYIGRGISGQTTQQMLVRFRPDVIDLKPRVVVLLAGTNDIAGNTGRSTDKMIEDDIADMVDLAQANGIKVVLLAITPAAHYSWQPSITDSAERIVTINRWLKDFAASRPGEIVFVDTHTPMKDENNAMQRQLSADGVHPNAAGYAVIDPLVEAAIEQALALH